MIKIDQGVDFDWKEAKTEINMTALCTQIGTRTARTSPILGQGILIIKFTYGKLNRYLALYRKMDGTKINRSYYVELRIKWNIVRVPVLCFDGQTLLDLH